MRETNYRGMTKKGEWVFGYYVMHKNHHYLIEPPHDVCYPWMEVSGESVAQYIGINDVDGDGIYENDVVTDSLNPDDMTQYTVTWNPLTAGFDFVGTDDTVRHSDIPFGVWIIGNGVEGINYEKSQQCVQAARGE